MTILQRLTLALVWRHAFNRVRAELSSYSARELSADLRLNLSDIPGLAAEAADQEVADFVRSRPAYREAAASRRGRAAIAA